jgi:hypothetical protein
MATAAPAPARWTAPEDVGDPAGYSTRTAVETNARGDRLLGAGNVVAFAPEGRGFGTPRGLGATVDRARYALDARGNAMIAGSYDDHTSTGPAYDEFCCFVIRAIARRRDGQLGAPMDVSPHGVDTDLADVAIRSPRDFGVLWSTRAGVYARLGDGRGGLGPVTQVAAGGIGLHLVSTRGGARAYYRSAAKGTPYGDSVRVVELDRDGRAGRPRTVVTGLREYAYVDVSDRGRVVALGTSGRGSEARTFAAVSGRGTAPRETTLRTSFYAEPYAPVVRVARDGSAVAAWRPAYGTGVRYLMAATARPGRPFTRARPVLRSTDGVSCPVVDVGTGGRIAIATQVGTGISSTRLHGLVTDLTLRLRSNHALDGRVILGACENGSVATAIDDEGRATVAWSSRWLRAARWLP